jgi:flagellar protein FliO/FliZ
MSPVANMGGALPMGLVGVMAAGVAPPPNATGTSHDGGVVGEDAAVVVASVATSPQAGDAASTAAATQPAAGDVAKLTNAAPQAPAQTPGLATPAAPVASAAIATATPVHTTTAHAAKPATFGQAPSAAGAVGGTVFALLFVLALILALAWLAKRMPGVAGAGNPALRIVGSLSLGPRERVVVVDVGGTQLLLGVGAGGTRALHTLAAPLPVAERAPATPFAQLLAQHFGKKA